MRHPSQTKSFLRFLMVSSALLVSIVLITACASGMDGKTVLSDGGDRSLTAVSPEAVVATKKQTARGTDLNAAQSLLYRWWGIFEAPSHVNITPFLTDMFDEDVRIDLSGTQIHGRESAIQALLQLPDNIRYAHHIESVKVDELGGGLFVMEAKFVYQIVGAEGKLTSGRTTYNHTLKKRPDGRLVFTEMTLLAGERVEGRAFVNSYIENRAKAVVIQYQTVMDSLSGDPSGLRELITSDAEFNGLKVISEYESGVKDDGVIRGFTELAEWFEQGSKIFSRVDHTKLELFSVKELGENRYEALAQFEWKAQTPDGKEYEQHTPLTWILVDDGERYMRIKKLL